MFEGLYLLFTAATAVLDDFKCSSEHVYIHIMQVSYSELVALIRDSRQHCSSIRGGGYTTLDITTISR